MNETDSKTRAAVPLNAPKASRAMSSMKPTKWGVRVLTNLAIACLLAMSASAGHVNPCVVVSADPASLFLVETPEVQDESCHVQVGPVGPFCLSPTGNWGGVFYFEERGNPFGVPLPGSAFLFGSDDDGDGVPELFDGEGSWLYEEENGLDGLQRGGVGLLGDWFPPGCDQDPNWRLTDLTVPCVLVNLDPITDESCHAGPDNMHIALTLSPNTPLIKSPGIG